MLVNKDYHKSLENQFAMRRVYRGCGLALGVFMTSARPQDDTAVYTLQIRRSLTAN